MKVVVSTRGLGLLAPVQPSLTRTIQARSTAAFSSQIEELFGQLGNMLGAALAVVNDGHSKVATITIEVTP